MDDIEEYEEVIDESESSEEYSEAIQDDGRRRRRHADDIESSESNVSYSSSGGGGSSGGSDSESDDEFTEARSQSSEVGSVPGSTRIRRYADTSLESLSDGILSQQEALPQGPLRKPSKASSETKSSSMGVISIPYRRDRSTKSLMSQTSSISKLSSSRASHSSNLSHLRRRQDAPDDNSEPSINLQAIQSQISPTSTLSHSYVKRTPEAAERARRQIVSMDGTITILPFATTGTGGGSGGENLTPTSRGSSGNPLVPDESAKRMRDALQKSYFAATQDLFSDALSEESMPSVTMPRGNQKRDTSTDTDDTDDLIDPITCCGCFVCPSWCASVMNKTPSLSQISLSLVNALPCFRGRITSDRDVLIRLNILCIFMTFIQMAMAIWLAVILLLLDDRSGVLQEFAPHFWNCNGATLSTGILASLLMVTCFNTIRVIKEVYFARAIRCLWVVVWILPFEIFFNISLYDYYNVTQAWIRHWWLDDNMSWFRLFFCEEGTADSTCLVPINGGVGYPTEDAWCLGEYDSIGCTKIRDDAQDRMERFMLTFYTGLAGWTSVFVVLLVLVLKSLQQIITKPVVQKSRESNVPAWLFLPTITNAMVGGVLHFSPSSLLSDSSTSDQKTSWIGVAYLVVACLFLISLLTGWFLSSFTIRSNADKRSKNVAVVIIIIMMGTNVAILAGLFVGSLLRSANLFDSPIQDIERGIVACMVDRAGSCTNCDNEMDGVDRCPEWTLDEVTHIMQTQLKQSAALAVIFILYAISVLRFGITLRKHLSLYQIDYV